MPRNVAERELWHTMCCPASSVPHARVKEVLTVSAVVHGLFGLRPGFSTSTPCRRCEILDVGYFLCVCASVCACVRVCVCVDITVCKANNGKKMPMCPTYETRYVLNMVNLDAFMGQVGDHAQI